jgi:hypothetical protein
MTNSSIDFDDDFFGDDEDALPDLDARAHEQQYRNIGYLEAFDESKEQKLQQGFDDGYRSTLYESVKLGELLAEAALQGDTSTVKRIKQFLENMVRREQRPSVTQEELRQLHDEIKALRVGANLS